VPGEIAAAEKMADSRRKSMGTGLPVTDGCGTTATGGGCDSKNNCLADLLVCTSIRVMRSTHPCSSTSESNAKSNCICSLIEPSALVSSAFFSDCFRCFRRSPTEALTLALTASATYTVKCHALGCVLADKLLELGLSTHKPDDYIEKA
jgi:hypothetical protein